MCIWFAVYYTCSGKLAFFNGIDEMGEKSFLCWAMMHRGDGNLWHGLIATTKKKTTTKSNLLRTIYGPFLLYNYDAYKGILQTIFEYEHILALFADVKFWYKPEMCIM